MVGYPETSTNSNMILLILMLLIIVINRALAPSACISTCRYRLHKKFPPYPRSVIL